MNDGFVAHPELIVEKGDSVKAIAANILKEIDAIESETVKIGAAWDDEASKKYIAQINSYKPKFQQLQTEINNIGTTLINHGNKLIEDRDGLAKKAEDL